MKITQHLKDLADAVALSGASNVITNGAKTGGALSLDSVEATGSIPIIYTGNGTTQDITTPMKIANDNGDGSTLAQPWTNVASYTVGEVAIDDSASGDQLAYENITGTNSSTNPLLDTTNWKLATNQYGGRFRFKNRDATDDNKWFDSIRRELNNIESNTTAIEANLANSLTTIGVSTLTVGSDVTVNTNAEDYVVWVDQTTRKTAGYRTDAGVMQNSKNNVGTDLMVKDSAGNPIIEHYNPTTGFSITMDNGNGVAGRSIPHSLQSKPSFITKKKLTTEVHSWAGYDKISGATKYMLLDTTAAAAASSIVWNDTEPTEENYTVGTYNGTNTNNEQYISYLQADSANHYIGAYTGSGVVGNVVDFGLDMTVAGSYVMMKKLNGTANWCIFDNTRGGVYQLQADTSASEYSDNPISFTSNGVSIDNTNNNFNASGGLYLIQAYSPKYAQPTDGSEIGVNADIDLTYTQGIGQVNLQETTLAHTIDLSAFAGDTAYILKERGSDAIGLIQNLGVGQSRIDADRWG